MLEERIAGALQRREANYDDVRNMHRNQIDKNGVIMPFHTVRTIQAQNQRTPKWINSILLREQRVSLG